MWTADVDRCVDTVWTTLWMTEIATTGTAHRLTYVDQDVHFRWATALSCGQLPLGGGTTC